MDLIQANFGHFEQNQTRRTAPDDLAAQLRPDRATGPGDQDAFTSIGLYRVTQSVPDFVTVQEPVWLDRL